MKKAMDAKGYKGPSCPDYSACRDLCIGFECVCDEG